jgi:hypothetical protein
MRILNTVIEGIGIGIGLGFLCVLAVSCFIEYRGNMRLARRSDVDRERLGPERERQLETEPAKKQPARSPA